MFDLFVICFIGVILTTASVLIAAQYIIEWFRWRGWPKEQHPSYFRSSDRFAHHPDDIQ